MTMRLVILGFELAKLTIELPGSDDPAPAEQPPTRADRIRRQAKRSAAWWALG